jgi:hypothetical protein
LTAWPPAVWALALALVAGAFASALAAGAVFGLSLMGLGFTLSVTLGHAVLFGLPTALYFRRRRWTHVLAAVAGGFVVGALPIGLFLAGSTLFDGSMSARRLLQCLEIAGTGGALGAPGGLAFWLTLRAFGKFRQGSSF